MKRALVLLVLLLAGVGVAILLPRSSRPSLVLITLDTTRADHLSCYGDGKARTPRIDALAADGVLFEQASTVAPLTLPSHTSMLTGVFPPDHGVRDNGFYRLPPEAHTVPERLADAGYRTAAFVSSVILHSRYGLAQGFDVYGDTFDDPLDVETRFPVSRRAKETVGRAIEWLDKVEDDEPFFLWVHLYDAHAPYDPPGAFRDAYLDSPYAGEIAYADLALDPLIARLREMRGDDLVVVIAGDHGEALGDHKEPTHGYYVHESTIRVPMILSGGPFRGGRRIEEPVRTVDLAATLLELAGLDAPDELRGRDLTRVVDGELTDLPGYSEAWTPISFGWSGLRSLRVGHLKVIEGPRAVLHDLVADPLENDDAAAAHPEAFAALRAQLDRLASAPGHEDTIRALSEEDARALAALGYLNAAGGEPGKIPDVVIPARADPRDRIEVYLLVLRSRGLVREGRAAKAAELLTRATALDPLNPHLRLDRAQALVAAGQADEAADDLRYAMKHLDDDPRPAVLLARIHLAGGETGEAEKDLVEALRRNPNHFTSLALLGRMQLAAKRYDDAIRTYEHALRLSRNPRLLNNLAVALVRGHGDRKRALELLREAIAAAPGDGALRVSIGDALIRAGRLEEARAELLTAKEILGERADISRLLKKTR
jgi:arylsulfatase A-like enzyme/Flp pilus assembly protein TadD